MLSGERSSSQCTGSDKFTLTSEMKNLQKEMAIYIRGSYTLIMSQTCLHIHVHVLVRIVLVCCHLELYKTHI